MMSKDIKNKVVLITGGASGIGYEIADRFLEKGACKIILVDINEKLGSDAIKTFNLKYGNDKVYFFNSDVTSAKTLWKTITDTFKDVDVLVNNAGIVHEKDVKRSIDVNVTALIELSFMFWEHNRKDKSGKGGTIINLASIYGIRSYPISPVYQASKFAVMGFTKSLGHQYNFKRSGVRVVAICPGFTETNLHKNYSLWDDTLSDYVTEFVKVQLWQKVDSVGRAAVVIFEKAESGTAWLIEGGEPIKEV
ncbi:alcohol dehydrogenase 2-like [Leptidea sinapis]|uniref:alcohol dehydrogenase 2-like n=1 Tax=Leptidea sinapis TaxID=189913 RepID=UPI00212F9DFB|nr:alcohol dehydrogenase 2-like isoform X1 [Leptidea sinapis]XP_050684375.1 alcohol dehydrogenase 2-like [Leptidea sinapis]